MGQRTNILLKLEKDGKTRNYLYHLQWGFCKVMPAALMIWALKRTYFYNKADYQKDYDFFEENNFNFLGNDFNNNILDITKELTPEQQTKNIDITNLSELKEILRKLDNNNGYMVIELKQKSTKYLPEESCKIGFIQGVEDIENYDEMFTQFINPMDFMKKSGGKRLYDTNFKNSFLSFCKAWEIEIIK